MAGRRASYLNPVRFYVFTSFVFFLFFFNAFTPKNQFNIRTDVNGIAMDSILNMDSARFKHFIDIL
jgi:hypothetical protein